MDKGIRSGVKWKFNEMLPQLATLGGKAFRRQILDWTVEEYKCSMAAASTHYNFAKHDAAKAVPEQLAGLGRAPEKNNGGRKKKAEFVGPVKPTEGETAGETVAETAAVKLYTVTKAKDGTVVAENLPLEKAEELVARAAAQKKAKLVLA